MTAKLLQWNGTYTNSFQMFSIGKSIQGRELWGAVVSTSLGDQTVLKPNVKYIGNMHGDEVVGRELLMRFLERLLTEDSVEVRDLVNSMNIYVIPTMNPDGFALGRRGNYNGYDLNRNFPDQYRSTTGVEQVETHLVKAFLASKQWTLSANFHGGDLVANYPWDGRPDSRPMGENASPDDDVFRTVSKVYAKENPGMMTNSQFSEGITNGAAWYVLFGGMQDFNYIHHGCFEITLEVSANKWPAGSELNNFWIQNKKSMLNYLAMANTGIRGRVYDAISGEPIENVQVTAPGREITKVKTRKENGAFFRILPAGSWPISFSRAGYFPKVVNFNIQTNSFVSNDVALTKMPIIPSEPSPSPSTPPTLVNPPHTNPSLPPNQIIIPGTGPSSTIPSAIPLPEARKTPSFPLISTSDSWVLPMFGVVGAFAAIAVTLVAYIIFQQRGINITGSAPISAGFLPSESQ
jgi:hypothetical protein